MITLEEHAAAAAAWLAIKVVGVALRTFAQPVTCKWVLMTAPHPGERQLH